MCGTSPHLGQGHGAAGQPSRAPRPLHSSTTARGPRGGHSAGGRELSRPGSAPSAAPAGPWLAVKPRAPVWSEEGGQGPGRPRSGGEQKVQPAGFSDLQGSSMGGGWMSLRGQRSGRGGPEQTPHPAALWSSLASLFFLVRYLQGRTLPESPAPRGLPARRSEQSTRDHRPVGSPQRGAQTPLPRDCHWGWTGVQAR